MQSPLIDVASCMGRAIFCGGGVVNATGLFLETR